MKTQLLAKKILYMGFRTTLISNTCNDEVYDDKKF